MQQVSNNDSYRDSSYFPLENAVLIAIYPHETPIVFFANLARISELGTSASETSLFANTMGTRALSYIEHLSPLVTDKTSGPLNSSAKDGFGEYAEVGTVAT